MGVSLLDIADRLGHLAQPVRFGDDGSDRSRFNEVFQDRQVLLVHLRDERDQSLAHEQRQRERLEEAIETGEPAAARCPDKDVRASGG